MKSIKACIVSRLLAPLFLGLCTAVSNAESDAWSVRYSGASNLPPDSGDQLLSSDKGRLVQLQALNKGDPSSRVVGGNDVELLNFAEVVRIRFSDADGPHTCTGVLISLDAILTAGHCGCGEGYEVYIQTGRVETNPDRAFKRLPVTDGPVTFPGYNCSGNQIGGAGRDLAVLRLAPLTPILSDSVDIDRQRVRLNFPVVRSTLQVLSNEKTKSLYIVGFGATETGRAARNLQGANVGVLSRHCLAGHVFRSFCARFREFAMGRTVRSGDPVDSCGGDSGGPAYRMDTDFRLDPSTSRVLSISERTLVGIVSRALVGVIHPYQGYCGGGGIYTAIGTRPVLEWLRSQNIVFRYSQQPDYTQSEDQHVVQ
ncbi:trypsin-like serine protease [Rhizobium leguminosarum]|uniref:S1 family peptidase n=1 Tax=Rhizobium leguminosarum TaxID=384 RepID=UPI001C986A50|nr:trypsin-like serine protease [Rhizobium leguminosarum]MBY5533647.1 trypsin-like serine protease [Rhizobium leguminosarum]